MQPADLSSAKQPTPAPTPKPRALIVEHERVASLDLRSALAKLGYEVVGTTSRTQTVLSRTQQRRPDVVIMDVRHVDAPQREGIPRAEAWLRVRCDVPVVRIDLVKRQGALSAESLRAAIETATRRHHVALKGRFASAGALLKLLHALRTVFQRALM